MAAALAFAGGCLSLEVPGTFLVIEKGLDELKAITPDEAKLWAREFSDPDDGTFDFWADALRNDFTRNRGYTLIEERAVSDAEGRKGLELIFEITAQGLARRYLVTLFVIEGWLSNTIRVIEFVAPRDAFDRYLEDVRKAIRTAS